MIHLVASGPSVLTSWNNNIPNVGDTVCAISGAARYVDNSVLDWWVAADRATQYSPFLDPPTLPQPKMGVLTDAPSALCFHGSGMHVEVHDHCWPLPGSIRRFSAPCAAVWLLNQYEDHDLQLYGVDLHGDRYAWSEGPKVDHPSALIQRWDIERRAWRVIHQGFPSRVHGLPAHLFAPASQEPSA